MATPQREDRLPGGAIVVIGATDGVATARSSVRKCARVASPDRQPALTRDFLIEDGRSQVRHD